MAVATSPPRPASRATPSLRGLVLALFVASGAAGLIYQVVWSRELVLVFGNTTQAVATIVTAFMAGLGFGSLAGGRLADTSRRPLRLYGLVELAVATMAALAPLAFHGLAEVYRGVWPSLVERPGQLAGVRFGLALAAVAPATFLMGMTLPLLTRYLVRTLDEAGARLGELYAANTIGAMAGTLLGGFVLIEFLGLRRTGYLAVALNLALFVNAAILIMAAATFGRQGIVVDSLGQAHETLRPLLGPLAATGFAVALLASGLASSTTGSLAGQLVLDGLLGWRVPAVARRAVTLVPAVVVLAAGVNEVAALVWSQIALSLALPAVAIPLVALTSRRQVMGELANRAPLRRLATAAVALLVALNLVLLASLLT